MSDDRAFEFAEKHGDPLALLTEVENEIYLDIEDALPKRMHAALTTLVTSLCKTALDLHGRVGGSAFAAQMDQCPCPSCSAEGHDTQQDGGTDAEV